MSNTMDTDYGLPVPMHRPFITLDEQSDSQLPFRRRLEQVTELTAENATPYQLPKQQRLSAFECLPYEVREQIYGYLGIIPVNRSQRNRSTTSVILYKHDRNQYICNRGMLGVNRNIRQEVLSTFVLKLEMCFEYPLSDRKVFYNNWHNAGWSNFSRGPAKMERMSLPTSFFEFVGRVRLDRPSYLYPLERPHPLRTSNKQTRRHLARLAESVHFVSKYCPMLQSLHFELSNQYWQYEDPTPVRALEPLVPALKHLVECCTSLQVTGATSRVILVTTSKDGSIMTSSDPMSVSTHDIDLRLDGIKVHAREDVVERWCRTTLRECLEYTGNVQFVSLDYLDACAVREETTNIW